MNSIIFNKEECYVTVVGLTPGASVGIYDSNDGDTIRGTYFQEVVNEASVTVSIPLNTQITVRMRKVGLVPFEINNVATIFPDVCIAVINQTDTICL